MVYHNFRFLKGVFVFNYTPLADLIFFLMDSSHNSKIYFFGMYPISISQFAKNNIFSLLIYCFCWDPFLDVLLLLSTSPERIWGGRKMRSFWNLQAQRSWGGRSGVALARPFQCLSQFVEREEENESQKRRFWDCISPFSIEPTFI